MLLHNLHFGSMTVLYKNHWGEGVNVVGETGVRQLVAGARDSGLAGILNALRRALETEVALFDSTGNVLSAVPPRALWDFDAVSAVSVEVRRSKSQLSVQPVRVGRHTVALLAANVHADPNQLLPVAVDLIALEISRLRARHQGRLQALAMLFEDVFQRRVSEADASARLAAFGIDLGTAQRVIVGWDPAAGSEQSEDSWGSLAALVHGQPDPLAGVRLGIYTVMLVPDDAMVWRLAQTLHRHLASARPGGDATVRVGVSFPHTGSSGLRAAYYEALSASQEGPGVQLPSRLDLAQLLVMTNTAMSLVDLAAGKLGPIIEYDRVHNSELLHTLRVFLAHNRQITPTTEALYVHRNTLRYRRTQIEELTGTDLDNSADITNLWIALAILDDAQTGETDA